MIEYTLKLNGTQAGEVLKAIDLLMRLKINQPHEISRAVMPDDYWRNGKVDKDAFDDFIHRRDRADDYLKKAFREIFPTWEDVKKDSEWHTLYNILQALRYQRHLAESPCSTGVDSYPPMHFGGEPIPECSWAETTEEQKKAEKPITQKVRKGKWKAAPGKAVYKQCSVCGMLSVSPQGNYCKWCGMPMEAATRNTGGEVVEP